MPWGAALTGATVLESAADSRRCDTSAARATGTFRRGRQGDAAEHDRGATADGDVHGRSVSYIEAGSGPVLLLIHGMAGTAENWEAVIEPLACATR